MRDPKSDPRSIIVRRVRLWWYAAALVPILGLGYLAGAGYLPAPIVLLVLFAAVFWLFSLLFALYAVLTGKNRKEPRQ